MGIRPWRQSRPWAFFIQNQPSELHHNPRLLMAIVPLLGVNPLAIITEEVGNIFSAPPRSILIRRFQ